MKRIRLCEIEAQLSIPILTDFGLIDEIYRSFSKIVLNEKIRIKRKNRIKRLFAYIVLYLYSPITLAGGKINPGLRKELQNIFQFRSPSAISNICASAIFWHDQYNDFRRDIELIYSKLMKDTVNQFKEK